jgi:TM2 domain-containing membrane protein YozV
MADFGRQVIIEGMPMTLSTEQQILIEQRVTNEAKSTTTAYLLWFFLGMVGAHRFYLGKTGSGIAIAVLSLLGFLTMALLIGFLFLLISGIWVMIDAALIPGIVAQQRGKLRDELTMDASHTGEDDDL